MNNQNNNNINLITNKDLNFINLSNLDAERLKNSLEDLKEAELKQVWNVEYSEPSLNEVNSNVVSSTSETQPWFLNDTGHIVNWNQPITLFDSVQLVHRYLKLRFNKESESLSEIQINKFLEPFILDKEVTVLDLYRHIDSLYSKNKTYFDAVKEDMILTTNSDLVLSEGQNTSLKPLGKLGDTTFNEAAVRLQELNWNIIVDNTKIGINALPAAINFVSYTLLIKTYMKHIHHRPFQSGMSEIQRKAELLKRNRHLYCFTFLVAPSMILGLKTVGLGTNNIFNIEINNSVASDSKDNVTTMGIFGFIFNKLPNWFKFGFKFVFILILVLKLLGFSLYTDFYLNTYNLKLLILILSSLVILNILLHLYLIHKFSQKDIQIPEIFPEFLIKWLSQFKIIVSTPAGIKAFKDLYYRELLLYIVFFIFIAFTLLY